MPRKYEGPPCSVEDCSARKHKALGLCSTHYMRWLRHEDVARGRVQDNPGYSQVHTRLKSEYGEAFHYACDRCGRQAESWAYDHNAPDERYEIAGQHARKPFSPNVQHYTPLCWTCHNTHDPRRNDGERKAAKKAARKAKVQHAST